MTGFSGTNGFGSRDARVMARSLLAGIKNAADVRTEPGERKVCVAGAMLLATSGAGLFTRDTGVFDQPAGLTVLSFVFVPAIMRPLLVRGESIEQRFARDPIDAMAAMNAAGEVVANAPFAAREYLHELATSSLCPAGRFGRMLEVFAYRVNLGIGMALLFTVPHAGTVMQMRVAFVSGAALLIGHLALRRQRKRRELATIIDIALRSPEVPTRR